MNRAYLIILIPALLVLIGYVLVFRMIGIALPYPALIVPAVLLAVAVVWMIKKTARKTGAGAK